jgi:FSR family fosmidomycin resistance protein-like MFS transporter
MRAGNKFGLRHLFSGMIPLFMLAHFAHHLLTALPVPLLPFIRDEFALDYAQAGLVVSAFSLSYGIGQLPAGWLADRLGPRLLITVGICGVAVAGLFVGFSNTYILLIVFLVVMGLVGGGYHPSAAPLIGASVEPRNRGRVLGFHLIGGSGSFFLAPLIAAGIAAAWGWRGTFIALAIPTGIFGVLFYILLRRISSRGQGPGSVVTEYGEQADPTPGRIRRLVAFLVLTTFVQAISTSVIAFIPLFMVDNFGVAEGTAAAFLSIIYSAGFWASPLGGYISDRLGRVPVILVSSLLTAPVIYLLNITPSGFAMGALLLVFGMVMYVRGPTSEAFLVGEISAKHRSTIFGIFYFSGMEFGAVLTPLMGLLIDRFGFNVSFTAAGITLFAVASICGLFLRGSRS